METFQVDTTYECPIVSQIDVSAQSSEESFWEEAIYRMMVLEGLLD